MLQFTPSKFNIIYTQNLGLQKVSPSNIGLFEYPNLSFQGRIAQKNLPSSSLALPKLDIIKEGRFSPHDMTPTPPYIVTPSHPPSVLYCHLETANLKGDLGSK